ncbi:MAG: DUF2971 domain-containing protein [Methanocorpusculum sp.]|jgi:hypothetical protein|nr:DUF2971 domain-containing protein [Methanocorpusculum sp.]
MTEKKLLEERAKWVKLFFRLNFESENNLQRQKDGENRRMARLSNKLGFLYKYRPPSGIQKLIESLKEGTDPTIKLSQPNEFHEFNDHFDTYIAPVYRNLPVLRKDMATRLAALSYKSGYLSIADCEECRQKCLATLSIIDFEEWLTALAKINIEYQPGVTETVSQIVKFDMQKFSAKHTEYWKCQIKQLGISCFCEKNDINYMWEKYSENHTGFCLAYDVSVFDNIPHTPTRKICGMMPVRYMAETPDLIELETKFSSSHFDKSQTLTPYEDRSLVWKTVLTKTPCWEREMEWRLVSLFTQLQDDNVPKDEDRYVPLHPSCIYLGKDFDEVKEQEIRNLAGSNILVKRMRLSQNGSKLIAGN